MRQAYLSYACLVKFFKFSVLVPTCYACLITSDHFILEKQSVSLKTSGLLMEREIRPLLLLKDHPIHQVDDQSLTSFRILCKHLFCYRMHVYFSRH